MNRRGFSVIDLMLACALAGISGLALMSFGQLVSEYSRKANVKFGVSDVRSEIMMITMDRKAWGLNIEKAASSAESGATYNPEMSCLKDKTACGEGVYDLTLFDATGKVLVDATNPNQGFTSKGAQCFSYGATDGTEGDCIFRYQMKWEAVCPPASTSCINPQVHLKLSLMTSSQQQSTFMNMRTNQVAMNMIAADLGEISASAPPPPTLPPPDPSLVSYTNSTLYSPNNTIVIDLTAYVEDPATMTFALSAPNSSAGGTVTIAGTNVTYTPAAGYYGHDTFPFVATDAFGTVKLLNAKVEVMTPHSWTGSAGDKDASNPQNWCGEVVANKCDHASFGATGLLGTDSHVVFDDTCLAANCDADFPQSNLVLRRYEQKATFKSTVTMNCAALNVNSLSDGAYSLSNKISNSDDTVADLDIQGGTFKAVGNCAATVYGCAHIGSGVVNADLFKTMNIYTDKNPLGTKPAAGTCTGFKAEATKDQMPNFQSSDITLTPVKESKPELYLDPSLNLAKFKTGKCMETYSTCQVYYTSDLDPATTATTNAVNGNFKSTMFNAGCKQFFDEASSLVIDSTNDVVKSGFAGTYVVPQARNATVSSGAGTLFIRSAIKVLGVSGIAGDTAINAGSIDGISGIAGTLCVKSGEVGGFSSMAGDFYISATTVGPISGGAGDFNIRAYSIEQFTGGAGTFTAKAKSIGTIIGAAGEMNLYVEQVDTIKNGAMDLNLYGTTVQHLSNFAGTVCLYNGAKLVNPPTSFAGTVKDCGTAPVP